MTKLLIKIIIKFLSSFVNTFTSYQFNILYRFLSIVLEASKSFSNN